MENIVYRYIDINGNIIYVGKTGNLKQRFNSHKKENMHKECYKVEYIELENPADIEIYETYYINKYRPKYNTSKVYNCKPSFYIPEQEWKVYYKNIKNDIRKSTEIKIYEEIFKDINKCKFNNKLPMPRILTSNKSSEGAFKEDIILETNGNLQYIIELNEEFSYNDLKSCVICLFHNMIHLYCFINNIKDTSRNCQYHNKRFSIVVKEHGGITEKYENGYHIIDVDHELKGIIDKYKNQFNKKNVYTKSSSRLQITNDGKILKKSSTRKYICPICGNSFRATKDINVLCMDCNVQFIKENVVYA